MDETRVLQSQSQHTRLKRVAKEAMGSSLANQSLVAECLSSALPVSTLPRLLRTLADMWSRLTHCGVCVTAVDASEAQRFAALQIDGELNEWHDTTEQVQWRARSIEQWLHGAVEARGFSVERTLAFDSIGNAIGGVCILGDNEPSEAEATIVDVSSRLVGQWQEAADLRRTLAGRLPDDAKLEAMAEFAAGAGHEINNPLGTISGRIQMLLPGETAPDRRLSLETIGAQALRIRDMIGDAMLFARPPHPVHESVSMSELAREVVEALASAAEQLGNRLVLECDDQCLAEADPTQARVTLGALINNAIEATEQGEITISVSEGEFAGAVVIQVTDTGTALSADELEHMFDPFYSGRQAGRGLGFGLSKSWRIVTMHGGTIRVESTATGTRFTVQWPKTRAGVGKQGY